MLKTFTSANMSRSFLAFDLFSFTDGKFYKKPCLGRNLKGNFCHFSIIYWIYRGVGRFTKNNQCNRGVCYSLGGKYWIIE